MTDDRILTLPKALIALLVLAVPLGLNPQTPAAGRQKILALIVGVNEFADAGAIWTKFADQDARLLGQHLNRINGAIADADSIVLTHKDATKTRILDALKNIIRKATPEHDVYLFFSANGRATQLDSEGYIGTFDGHGENGQTTIRIRDLRSFLLNCGARRVFLFADVSREQPVNGQDNRINLALLDLSKLKSPEVTGLLATEPGSASQESTALEGGHGLFGYFLVRGMEGGTTQYPLVGARTGGRMSLDQVFQYVTKNVPPLSQQTGKRAQKPIPLGKIPSSLLLARSEGGIFPAIALWAQNAPGPGLLPVAPGQNGIDSQTQTLLIQFRDAFSAGSLLDIPRVSALANQLTARAVDVDALSQHEVSVALEDAGQRIVAQYGTGDNFPEDPRRLRADHFDLAARLFSGARRLRETEPGVPTVQATFCGGSVRLVNSPEILSLEARSQFSLGRARLADQMIGSQAALQLDTAAQRLDCSMELDPELPQPLNAYGIVELLRARFDKAAERFNAAKRLAPNWAYPRHNLALTLTEQGKNREAENEYREAIVRTPFYPYLQYNLGLLLQRQGKTGEAEQIYGAAIRVFQQQIGRYQERGKYLADAGDAPESKVARDVAAVLTRNQAEAYNALGTVLERRRRLPQAEDNFKQAFALNPSLSAARHNLALLYLARADAKDKSLKEEARKLLELNVATDPSFHPSRLSLGRILQGQNDFAGAAGQFHPVLDAIPANTDARLGLARANAGLNRLEDAFDVLDLATLEQKSNPELAMLLGDLYRQRGDRPASCRAYTQAAALAKRAVFGAKRELKAKLAACRGLQ